MGFDRNKVIDVFKAEEGYLEKSKAKYNANPAILDSKTEGAGSDNYTKYWRDIYPSFQGNAWCNCSLIWAFVKAYGEASAKKLLCVSGSWSFYTPTSSSYFKKNNQWYTSNPQVGDVIYYKNSTRICHVGLVYKVANGYVYTIEGNTSSAAGVVANGGCVRMKQYSTSSSYIAGYGRPNYDDNYSGDTTTTTSSKTTQTSTAFTAYKVKCTASELNIRAGAGITKKVIGVLKKGHEFTIREVSGNWGKVCVHPDNAPTTTVTGWVSLKYCQKI